MHPALSVIFFTTLSGAGYGVLAVLGAMLANGRPALFAHGTGRGVSLVFESMLVLMLLLALSLVTIGLLSSTFHLGKPARSWRAFSQWRTSWLSREGVLAVLTYLPALALLWLGLSAVFGGDADAQRFATLARGLGLTMAVLALATVACTAMIYASLKPIPAWQHRLVVPAYLGFALQGGLAFLAAAVAVVGDAGVAQDAMGHFALAMGAVSAALVAIKLRYWRDIDRAPLPATRGDAVGLPGRDVSVFERPHSQDNYLTREMAFVLARKHGQRLRSIALALFGLMPMLAAMLAWVHPDAAAAALPLAALAALVGAFVERWLFFAQARHLVTLYY